MIEGTLQARESLIIALLSAVITGIIAISVRTYILAS